MIVGEMCLLIASVLIMIGAAKKITSRLYVNDYIATFIIFVIVLLNVRGGIPLTDNYRLFPGGILSVVIAFYSLIKRAERSSDIVRSVLSALVSAAMAFFYFKQFTEEALPLQRIVLLAVIPIGLWCAISAKRTFASCLFSALAGSFLGITLYQILICKNGDIGGGYSFAVMWLSTLLGIVIQYLCTFLLRTTKVPYANSYFEAGEMQEKSAKNEESKT